MTYGCSKYDNKVTPHVIHEQKSGLILVSSANIGKSRVYVLCVLFKYCITRTFILNNIHGVKKNKHIHILINDINEIMVNNELSNATIARWKTV